MEMRIENGTLPTGQMQLQKCRSIVNEINAIPIDRPMVDHTRVNINLNADEQLHLRIRSAAQSIDVFYCVQFVVSDEKRPININDSI